MPGSAVPRHDKTGNDRLSLERQARTFHHSSYPAARIAAARAERALGVSVCLPARECAETVGEIVAALGELRDGGGDRRDRGRRRRLRRRHRGGGRARRRGRPPGGRADALIRARCSARAMRCGARCRCSRASWSAFWTPTPRASPRTSPPACSGRWCASRGCRSSRPSTGGRSPTASGAPEAEGGGRVNHLIARPALELFYPQLAGVRQPLAGEVAARRELLERLPFATGYGVEIAMLIDVWREVGLEGIAQVDLEEHRNRHQPLSALTPMAVTVLATIAGRLEGEGRLQAASEPRRARPSNVRRLRAWASRERPLPVPRPRRHAARARRLAAARRRGQRCRSTACAPCRRACARTWRSC